jgi:hypothetical protein
LIAGLGGSLALPRRQLPGVGEKEAEEVAGVVVEDAQANLGAAEGGLGDL